MADESNNVIGISFGVKGGTDINGDSGARIKRELDAIANQIDLTVKVNVKAAKDGNGAITRGVEAQKDAYDALIEKLKTYYKAQEQLNKMPVTATGEQATVRGQLLKMQQQELLNSIEEQIREMQKIGALDSARTEEIKQQLQGAYELDKVLRSASEAQAAPKMASITELSKIGLKAQSLYTDNGFDKIIARSTEALRLVDDYNTRVREALANPDGISKTDLNRLNTQFLQTEEALKRIGAQTDTVGNKIREAFSARLVQRIAQIIILQLVRALRQVYQNVADINKSMTELKIVTQATSDQIDKAADNITRAARRIGASVSDLIDSTTVYARLGYSLADAQVLAEKTTMYANISGVNVDEATTNITGLIKAFNIGADGLENVLDQLIYVGNNFPISQAEIGEAINNAGSALAANGNSLQEAIGILTAANASLQNVSKASTAVRTVAARISRSYAELEELGENAGEVMSTAKLEALMGGFGIAIAKANGELRSTYDILNDLAQKWDDLKDTDQAAIVEALAGTRQQNAFYSIMSNWQEARDVVAEESDGIGSLMEAQGTYIDSVEGRMQQLNATFESFSANVLKSDLVKVVIRVLNGLMAVLNWIGSWFPTNEAIIVAFSMVVLTLGKRIVLGITEWITKLKEFKTQHDGVFKGLRQNYQQAIQDINDTKAALASLNNIDPDSTLGQALSTTGLRTEDLSTMYAQSNKQAAVMVDNLKATYDLTDDGAKAMAQWAAQNDQLTLKLNAATAAQARYMQAIVAGVMTAAGIIMSIANSTSNDIVKLCAGIVVAIGAIVTAVIIGIKQMDLAMKTNIIFAAISLAFSAIMMIVEACKALVPSFDNLKEKAKEAKDAWQEAKDELTEVTDKIKEVQEAIDELNAKGGLTLTEQQDLDRLNAELELLREEQAVAQEQETTAQRDAMNAAEKALDKWKSQNTIRDDRGEVIQTFDSRIADALKDYRNSGDREWAIETIRQYQDLLSGFEYGMNEKLDSYFNDYYKLLDMYTASTDSAVSAWAGIISRTQNKDAVKALRDFANTFTDTSKITGNSLKDLAAQNEDVKDLFDYLTTVGMWDGENWDNLTGLVGELRTKLKELSSVSIVDDIEAITDKFDALSDALKDVSDNGIVSLGTLQTLMDKYPSLLSTYFSRDLDGYKLQENYSGASNFDILQEMAVTSLKEYQIALEKAQETFRGLTQEDDDYETALKNLAIAQDNLNMKEIEWASILREAKIDEETDRLEALRDQLENQLDVYKELIDIRKDLLETYKDELDYQKELAKKQKDVADLQTQLAVARLDRSASGQARARELESQLQEAQEELDEYTLERAIEDITSALDNEYSEYEAFITAETEKISAQIENIAQTLKDILSGVEGLTNTRFTGEEMYNLYSELKQKEEAGMAVSGDAKEFMNRVSGGDYSGADQYYSAAKTASDAYEAPKAPTPELSEDEKKAQEMTKIKGAWGRGISRNSEGDNGEVVLNGTTYHVESDGDDSSLYKAAYDINGYGDRDIFFYKDNLYGCLDGTIVRLREQDGWGRFWNGVGNNNGWEALKRATGMYHSGGFVGDLSELRSNEEFAKLLKGEFVTTPSQMDRFMRKTLPAMVSGGTGSATINNNSPLIEIRCGAIDEDTLPRFKDIVNAAVKKVGENMESALHRSGFKK